MSGLGQSRRIEARANLRHVRYASDSDPIGARQRTVAMCQADIPAKAANRSAGAFS
jgi:hypothetical protein